MIMHVKEPLPAEYDLIREGQIIFTYLHLAADERRPGRSLKARRSVSPMKPFRNRTDPCRC